MPYNNVEAWRKQQAANSDEIAQQYTGDSLQNLNRRQIEQSVRAAYSSGVNGAASAGKRSLQGRLGRVGEGLQNVYERLFPRTLELAKRSAREYGSAELDMMQLFTPQYTAALEAANPEQAALRRRFTAGVTEDLNGGLSPSISREIQQGSRSAWASRGLVQSPAAAIDELFALGERGNALKQQNYGNALAALQAEQDQVTAPVFNAAGRSSTLMQPNYTDFTNDLFSYYANQQIAKKNAGAAKAAAEKQMIGGLAQGIGGLVGGAMACWVAREVYGEESTKWRQFRRWLFEEAPARLRRWYLRHGAEFAAWLREHPEYKPQVRAWMEQRI